MKIQTTEERIKKQEISKEETEEEIQALEKIKNEVKLLLDKTTPRTIAYQELKSFLNRLTEQIEINNDILDEIKQSIEFIRHQASYSV